MPSDLPVLVANVGLLVAVFGVGLAVTRRLQLDARRRALPVWHRLLLWLVAFPPLVSLLQREVDVGVVDGSVVAITVFVALWIGVLLLLTTVFDVEPATRTRC